MRNVGIVTQGLETAGFARPATDDLGLSASKTTIPPSSYGFVGSRRRHALWSRAGQRVSRRVVILEHALGCVNSDGPPEARGPMGGAGGGVTHFGRATSSCRPHIGVHASPYRTSLSSRRIPSRSALGAIQQLTGTPLVFTGQHTGTLIRKMPRAIQACL